MSLFDSISPFGYKDEILLNSSQFNPVVFESNGKIHAISMKRTIHLMLFERMQNLNNGEYDRNLALAKMKLSPRLCDPQLKTLALVE